MYVPCRAPYAPGCHMTLLGWAGRALDRSVATGVAYIRSMPCETKRLMPGTIKYRATRSLLHNTHLSLAESHTTHSQTNLHTSGVAGALGHTVRGLSADCGQPYQLLHPQSPHNKRKERKLFRHVEWHQTNKSAAWHKSHINEISTIRWICGFTEQWTVPMLHEMTWMQSRCTDAESWFIQSMKRNLHIHNVKLTSHGWKYILPAALVR